MFVISLLSFVLFMIMFALFKEILFLQITELKPDSAYAEIKRIGTQRNVKFDEGLAIFEPVRIMLSRYVNPEHFVNAKIKLYRKANLIDEINPLDVFLLKFFTSLALSLVTFIYICYHLYFRLKVNLSYVVLLLCVILFINGIEIALLHLIAEKRRKKIYKELFLFIPFFMCCINAGDSLLNAFEKCEIIEGEIGEYCVKTANRIQNADKLDALKKFSNKFEIPELTAFVNLIFRGESNLNFTFAQFIKLHMEDFNNNYMEKILENHEARPINLLIQNLPIFVGCLIAFGMPIFINMLHAIQTI